MKLTHAADVGDLVEVDRLLNSGVDVDEGGGGPLWVAALRGHIKIVQRLLDAGADVNAGEQEALREAEENGHVEIARLLRRAALPEMFLDVRWRDVANSRSNSMF